MRIGILGRADGWYARDLSRAALERGHVPIVADFTQFTARVSGGIIRLFSGEESLDDCGAVLVRTMPPASLEQVVFRMDSLVALAERGIQVVNSPRAIECAVDKFLTTMRLAQAGLPTPDTIVCENSEQALVAFEQLGGDVVVKPVFGSEGRGILRVSDPDLALRTFRTLERIQALLYLQRFVHHTGCDLRVMVLDGRILGAMRRCSADDFRTNVARSAQAEQVSITDQQAEWALRASEAAGTRMAGIDILYDRDGNGMVIEVNAVPGWQAFRRATGVDAAACLMESLEQYQGRADACCTADGDATPLL